MTSSGDRPTPMRPFQARPHGRAGTAAATHSREVCSIRTPDRRSQEPLGHEPGLRKHEVQPQARPLIGAAERRTGPNGASSPPPTIFSAPLRHGGRLERPYARSLPTACRTTQAPLTSRGFWQQSPRSAAAADSSPSAAADGWRRKPSPGAAPFRRPGCQRHTADQHKAPPGRRTRAQGMATADRTRPQPRHGPGRTARSYTRASGRAQGRAARRAASTERATGARFST
jgi:hypothetical protein